MCQSELMSSQCLFLSEKMTTMNCHGWLTMRHMAWFCTTEVVEIVINVTQHLAKKEDIYYYNME